jgi:hypothetical protein
MLICSLAFATKLRTTVVDGPKALQVLLYLVVRKLCFPHVYTASLRWRRMFLSRIYLLPSIRGRHACMLCLSSCEFFQNSPPTAAHTVRRLDPRHPHLPTLHHPVGRRYQRRNRPCSAQSGSPPRRQSPASRQAWAPCAPVWAERL